MSILHNISLGGFFMVIRGVVVVLPIIIVVIMLFLVIKKPHKSLVIVLILCIIFSLFIPTRMFLLNQKRNPNIDTDNLSFAYMELKNKLNSGQENRNDSNVLSTNEYRSVYRNEDESTIMIFVYDSSLNDEIDVLKETAVVKHTDGDVSIWASEMEPTSVAWFTPIIGVSGEFVMQNKYDNEVILVHYCIKDFDGFSAVFPEYPEFDIISYLLSCNALV